MTTTEDFDPIADAFAVSTWLVFQQDRFDKVSPERVTQAVQCLRAQDAEIRRLRGLLEQAASRRTA